MSSKTMLGGVRITATLDGLGPADREAVERIAQLTAVPPGEELVIAISPEGDGCWLLSAGEGSFGNTWECAFGDGHCDDDERYDVRIGVGPVGYVDALPEFTGW